MLGKLWAVWLLLGSLSMAIAVLLAAAGSHIFKASFNDETLRWFNNANQMHLIHSLALILIAVIAQRVDSVMIHFAAGFVLLGLVLFCGVLYLSAIQGTKNLIFMAPYGGMAFIGGWFVVAGLSGAILFRS